MKRRYLTLELTPEQEHYFEGQRILERFDTIDDWLLALGDARIAERRQQRERGRLVPQGDRPTHCGFCGRPLPPYIGGRYRRYCAGARNCRDRAYKARRRAAERPTAAENRQRSDAGGSREP